MEDLLASIRKAIDSDEDGQGASTAGEARGTLMRGALRELRVNLNETKTRNKEAREEIAELRAAMASGEEAAIKDEFGDLLFAIVNFGRHLKVDAEAALSGTNEKFRNRFHHVERALKDQGRSLEEASLEEMEALWQQAKGKPAGGKG